MKRLLLSFIIITGLIPLGSGSAIKTDHAGKDKPYPNSNYIEIDDMLLHYRFWSAAAPNDTLPWVLMVHGMGGSTFSWEYNAPVLSAAGFNVIAVDVPPFGYSDKNPNYNQSTDHRSEWLWKFLNQIRPGMIRKMLRSAYSQEPNPVDVAEYYKALAQKGFVRALLRSTAKSKTLYPVDGKEFNLPAIAIWGDKDTWVPLDKSKLLTDQIPSIRVIVIKGAGHCPMATHSELFNKLTISYLHSN